MPDWRRRMCAAGSTAAGPLTRQATPPPATSPVRWPSASACTHAEVCGAHARAPARTYFISRQPVWPHDAVDLYAAYGCTQVCDTASSACVRACVRRRAFARPL